MRRFALLAALLLAAVPSRALTVSAGPTYFQNIQGMSVTVLPDGRALIAGGDDGTNSTASVYVFDPKNGTLSAVASMNAARSGHTATLLPNGLVLVAGGSAAGSVLSSAELYDPVANTWSFANTGFTAQAGQSAVLLNSGRVMLFGGKTTGGTVTGLTQIYDPVAGSWASTGSLGTARYDNGVAVLQDGRVMAIGGAMSGGAEIPSVEVYYSTAGAWAALPSMTNARYGLSAAVLPDGRVAAVGGFKTGGFAGGGAPVEIYSPTLNTWSAGAVVPNSGTFNVRQYFSLILLPDGRLMAIAGDSGGGAPLQFTDTELYDPIGNVWAAGPSLSQARYSFASALLPDGNVLVVGGTGSSPVGPYSATEVLVTAPGAPASAGTLTTPRHSYSMVSLPGGKVLVAGGNNGSLVTASAELFDPQAGGWSPAASLSTARMNAAAALLPNGHVLVAGGDDGTGGIIATAEEYDPPPNLWKPAGALVTARTGAVSVPLPTGRVLVAGGVGTGSTYLTSAELYDPFSRTFLPAASMSTARYDATATLLPSGLVLVAGGQSSAGSVTATAELYDPRAGTWSSAGSMGSARVHHTAVLLPNGKVLVSGGYNGTAVTSSAELYDPAANSWSSTGGATVAREQAAAVLLPNGKVLVAGGFDGASTYQTAAEIYDPEIGGWKSAPSFSTARANFGMAVLVTRQIVAASGMNGGGVTASAELVPYTEFDVFNATNPARPNLSTINGSGLVPPVNMTPAGAFGLVGTTFTGVGAPDGGSSYRSGDGNLPRAFLRGLDGGTANSEVSGAIIDISTSIYGTSGSSEQQAFVNGTSSTQAWVTIPPNVNCGYYTLTMEANAFPSTMTVVRVAPAPGSNPPGAPSFVYATPWGVGVNWGSSTDGNVFSYVLSYSTDNYATGPLISSAATAGLQTSALAGSNLAAAPNALFANTTYFFRVADENCGGLGPQSGVALRSTLALPVASATPTIWITSATVTFTPNPPGPSSATAEGYVLDASTAPDFTGTLVSSATLNGANSVLTVTSLSGIGAPPYYFRVGALNWNGVPSYSPTSSISFPLDGSALPLFGGTISGLARGVPNGPSLSTVEVSIFDNLTTQWFNGSSFAAGPQTWSTATLVGNAWSYTNASLILASGNRRYTIFSRATDANGVQQGLYGAVTFSIDVTPPVSSISQPAAGQTALFQFPAVAGTAIDDIAGVSLVKVFISSGPSFGACWNGAAWANCTTSTFVPGTPAGANWSVTPGVLPGGAALQSGNTYRVVSRALDGAGNLEVNGSTVTFEYDTVLNSGNVGQPGGAVMSSPNGRHELGLAAASDTAGNVYVVSVTTTDPNFNQPLGVFLYKYGSNGALAAGPIQLAGDSADAALAVDGPGNVYVASKFLVSADSITLTRFDTNLVQVSSRAIDTTLIGNVSAMAVFGTSLYTANDGGTFDGHPKIVKYDQSLVAQATATYSAGSFASGHGNSDALALSHDGTNLYVVVSSATRRLLQYTASTLSGPFLDVDISGEQAFAPSVAVSTDNVLVYTAAYDVASSSEVLVHAHRALDLALVKTSTTTGAALPLNPSAQVPMGVSGIGNVFVGYTDAYDGQTYPGRGDYTVIKFDRDLNFQLSQAFNGPASSTDVLLGLAVLDSSNVVVTGASFNGHDLDATTVKFFMPGNQGANVAVAPANLAFSTIAPNGNDVPMLSLGLWSQNNLGASLNSLTVNLTGNAPAGNVTANWYQDSNANGVYDPGVDALLSSATFAGTTPPSVTLATGTPQAIGSTTSYFFLTVTYSSVTLGRALGIAVPFPNSFGLSGGFVGSGTPFPINSTQGLVRMNLPANPQAGGYQIPTADPNPTGGFDTGLSVGLGQIVVVTASGTWKPSAYGVMTASGIPTLGGLDPALRVGSLVGRFGGGQWFQLSTSAVVTANQTGDFFLAMNDTVYLSTAESGAQFIGAQVLASTSPRVWLGASGVNQNASVNANWKNGIPPGNGDIVVFDGSASNQSCNWDLYNANIGLLTMATSYTGSVVVAPAALALTVSSNVTVAGGGLALSANTSLIALSKVRIKGGTLDLGPGPSYLILGSGGLAVDSGTFRAAPTSASGINLGAVDPTQLYPISVAQTGSSGATLLLGGPGTSIVQIHDLSTLSIGTRAVVGALSNVNFDGSFFDASPRIAFTGTWTSTVSFAFDHLGFDLNTSTNVGASALTSGSTVTITNAFGQHFGSIFANDPSKIISWLPDGGTTGSISGTLTNAGGGSGTYYIAYSKVPNSGDHKSFFEALPGATAQIIIGASQPGAGAYTLSGLSAPNTYYIMAWRTGNPSHFPQSFDPIGGYGQTGIFKASPVFVSSNNVVNGANITIRDWSAVSGVVTNNSSQYGPIVIQAWNGVPHVGDPMAAITLPPLGNGESTSYALAVPAADGVSMPTNALYLMAFVDVYPDGIQEPFEAQGTSAAVTAVGVSTTTNVPLVIAGGSGAPGGTLFVGAAQPFTNHPGYIGYSSTIGVSGLPQSMMRLDLSASASSVTIAALRVDLGAVSGPRGFGVSLWRDDNHNGGFDNPYLGQTGDTPVGFGFVTPGLSSAVVQMNETILPGAPQSYFVAVDLNGDAQGLSPFQVSIASTSYFTLSQGSVAAQGLYPIQTSSAAVKFAIPALVAANDDDTGGVDTGIDLADGLFVAVSSITGLWRVDGVTVVPGTGDPGTSGLNTISPDANYGQLIGRIGDAEGFTTTDWFPIVQGTAVGPSGFSGRLYLAMNDYSGAYFDNSGAVFSTFSVTGSTISAISGTISYTGSNTSGNLVVTANGTDPNCPNCPNRPLYPRGSSVVIPLNGSQTLYPYSLSDLPVDQYYVISAQNDVATTETGTSDRAVNLSSVNVTGVDFHISAGQGGIAGNIVYGGVETFGDFQLGVTTVPNIDNNTFFFGGVTQAAATAYSITGLATPATYYLVGYRDVNGNNSPDGPEPFGYIGSSGPFIALASNLTPIFLDSSTTQGSVNVTLGDRGALEGGVELAAAVPSGDLVVIVGQGLPGTPGYAVENEQVYDISGFAAGEVVSYDVGLLRPSTSYSVFAFVSTDMSDVFKPGDSFGVASAPEVVAGGFSGVDLTLIAPGPPAAVTGFQGQPLSTTQLQFSWNTVPGATTYQLLTATNGVVASLADPTSFYVQLVSTNSFSLVTKIKALNGLGAGPVASIAAVASLAAVPGQPAFLVVNTSSATLFWSANGNPAGTVYKVLRATAPAGPYALTVASTTLVSTVEQGLLPSSSYYWAIDALGFGGLDSGPSVTTNTLTLAPFGPSVGGSISYAGRQTGLLALQISTMSTFTPLASSFGLGQAASQGYYVSVPPSQTYYLRAFIDVFGDGQLHQGEDVTVTSQTFVTLGAVTGFNLTLSADAMPPAAPVGLNVTTPFGQDVLSWKAPTVNADGTPLKDLAGFRVYRTTLAAQGFAPISNATVLGATAAVAAPNFTDAAPVAGVPNLYRVSAVDFAGNESLVSPAISATPFLGATISGSISDFAAQNTGPLRVRLSTAAFGAGTIAESTLNPFSFQNLPDGAYYVTVFRDLNADSKQQDNEPAGTVGGLMQPFSQQIFGGNSVTGLTATVCDRTPAIVGQGAPSSYVVTTSVSGCPALDQGPGYYTSLLTFRVGGGASGSAGVGANLSIQMRSPFANRLILLGPDGSVVAQNSNPGGASINFTAQQPGLYAIEPTSFNSGDVGDSTVTLVATGGFSGVIAGTVSYSGAATGKYVVQLFTSADPTAPPFLQVSTSNPIFSIGGLSDGVYYARAYRDANANFAKDAGEPSGFFGVSFSSLTAITIQGGVERVGAALNAPVHMVLTDPAVGTVAGQIVRQGTQTGPIVIFIGTPQCSNCSDVSIVQSTTIASAGPYTLSFVPPATNYFLEAFVDVNGNNHQDPLEARGSTTPITVQTGLTTGVSLLVSDPGSGGSGNATIQGVVSYTGPSTGPLLMGFATDNQFQNIAYLLSQASTGTFVKSGIVGGTSYYIAAFLDTNNNGEPDNKQGEPIGFFGAVPSNDFGSMQPVFVPSAGSTNTAITMVDAPDGSISGQVVYQGTQFIGKPLVVKAFIGGNNNGDFNSQSFTIPSVSSGVLYPYQLRYLNASSSFTVFGFVDANGNGNPDFGEPNGYFGQTTCANGVCTGALINVSSGIGLPTYGINVFIQDPGSQGGALQNTGTLDLEADYLGSQGGPIVFRAFTDPAMAGSPYRTLSVALPPGPGTARGKLTNLPFGTYYLDAFRDPAGSGVFNPAFDAYGTLPSVTLASNNSFQSDRSQNGIVDPGQGGSVNVFSGNFAAPGGARFDGGAVDIAAGLVVDSVTAGGPFIYVEGITKQNTGLIASLVKYSSSGVFMSSVTLPGGDNAITEYAVDNLGNLYVPGELGNFDTQQSTGIIQKFSPNLVLQQSVAISSDTEVRNLVFAGGALYAAFDGQSINGQLVRKYDPNTFVALATGTFFFPQAAFGNCQGCAGAFGRALGIDGAGDVFIVAESNFNPTAMASSLFSLLKFGPGLGSPVAQTDITSLVPNTGDHPNISLGVDAAGEVFFAVNPSGDSNVHTYKFSPSLQLQNSATFGPVFSHFGGGLKNLVVASTDNYIYEAWETTAHGGDMVALRYDTNLNLVAQRTFDGLDNAHEDFAFDLGVLNSSNVYLTGGATNAKGDLDWATVSLNLNTSGAQSGAGAAVTITTANAVNAIYGALSYAGTLVTSGTVRSALFPLGQQTPIRFSSAPFGASVPYLFNNVPAGSYQVQAFIDPNGNFAPDAGEPVGISSSVGFSFAATSNTIVNVALCDRRPIAFGQALQTTIAPPDCPSADENGARQRLFTFAGTRGQPVTIEADAINFIDAPVRLYDPTGALIVSADGGAGASIINSFVLPLDGLYTIGVSPFSPTISSATVKLSLGGGAGSLGSIAGSVTYNGVQGGRIVMALFSTSTFLAGNATPVQIQTINTAGPFTFSNLLTGSTYYLGAFVDVNANGRPDVGEDLGFFGSAAPAPILLRSGQNAAGVNFAILPSSAAATADLAGTVSYAGLQTGALHVELWSSASFSGQPSAARVVPTGAGAYDVPAPGGLPYYVRAWLDANNDGVMQASEPSGIYAPLNQGAQAVFAPSSGTLFGVNFSITDPGQLAGGFVGEGAAAISPSTAAAGAQVFSATITYTAGPNGLQPGATIGITVPAGFPPPNGSLITVTSTATATFSAIKITPSSFFAGVTAGSVAAGQQVKFVYTEGPVSCLASTQTWTVSESQNGAVAPQPLLAGSPSIQVMQGAPIVFQPSNPYLSLTQNVLSDPQYMIARDACGNQSVSTFTATVAVRAKRFDVATSQFVSDATVGVSTSVLASTAPAATLTFTVGQSSQPFFALSASTGPKNLETFFNLGQDTTFYYGLTALPGNALTNVSVSSVSFGVGQSSVTITPNGGATSLAFINFTLGDPSQSWHVEVGSVPFKSGAAVTPVWESWGNGQPNLGQIAWDGRFSPWINGGARVPSGFYYVRVEIGGSGGVHDDSILISVFVPQVSGQFRDAGITPNPPLSGAVAQVFGPNGTLSAQSDASGNYVLAGLAAGSYNMFVTRSDFLNATLNFTINGAGMVSTFTALSSNVSASTNAAGGIDVLMTRAAVLFVSPSFAASYSTSAVDQYGSLQVAATTTLSAANQQSFFSGLHVAAGTSTIDDGGQWDPSANQSITHTSFKFTVAPGTYTVSAFMPGFSVSTASVLVSNGLNNLVLPAFAAKSSVSGTVTLPSAAPAPNGAFVSLSAVPVSTAAAAVGGGAGVQIAAGQTVGTYTIFSLDSGSYTIRANANGYGAASSSVFLPVSSAVASVNLTLVNGAPIGGNITINSDTSADPMLQVNVSAWSPGALNFGSTVVYHAGGAPGLNIPYNITGLSAGAVYQVYVNVSGSRLSLEPQVSMPVSFTAPSAAAGVAFAASSGTILGSIVLPSGATDFANVSLSGVTAASVRPDDVGHTFFIPSSTEVASGSAGGFFTCQPSGAAPNAADGTCPAGNNSSSFTVTGMHTETDDVTFFYKTSGQSQKIHLSVVSGSTTSVKVDLSAVTYTISGSINNQITNALFNTNPNILANSPLIPLRDAAGNIVPVDPALAITSTATTARVLAVKQDISQYNVAISTAFDAVTSRVGFLTAAGTFTITNVPSGVYFVRSVGLRLCSTCAVSVPSVGQLVNVAGASVSGVTLNLSDGYSAAGAITLDGGVKDSRVFNLTVVNQRQEVVSSTQVYLGDVALGNPANSVNYSFSNLPANNFYTLTVTDAGSPAKYAGRPIKFPNPALSPNGLQSNLTAQNVTMQAGAFFTGRMQDVNTGQLIDGNSAGLLAPNFQISATAVPWVEGGFAQAPSGVSGRPIRADGTFLVGPLIPSISYVLKLGQQSWDPAFLASGSQNYTPVALAGLIPQPGQVMDVGVVTLNQGQSLSGVVYASTTTGPGLGNILVTAQPTFGNSGVSVQTYTNQNGRYTLWVSTYISNQYDVTAAARGGNLASNGTFYNQVTLHAVNLLATTTADFVLDPLQVTVTGQVLVADAATGGALAYPFGSQKGFPAAAVFMQPQGVVPTQNPLGDIAAISDSLGGFSVPGLSTGTYAMRVVSLGYAVFNATVTASTGTYVVYTGSNTPSNYLPNNVITLQRGATVTGRIVKSDGSAPNTSEVGGIAAANFASGEFVVGSVDADPVAKTVNSYTISGFKTGIAYNIVILPADKRDDVVSPVEGQGVSFQALESTTTKNINLTFNAAAMTCVATAKVLGNSQFQIKIDCNKDLRNVTAVDSDLSQILTISTYTSAGQALVAPSGTGQLNGGDKKISNDRKEITAIYRAAANETSFSLRLRATASTVDPKTGLNFATDQVFDFFTGLGSNVSNRIQNANGGSIQLEPSAQDELLGVDERSRIDLLPGTFAIGDASLPDSAVTASATTTITVGIAKAQDQQSASVLALHSLGYIPSSLSILSNPSAFPAELGAAMAKAGVLGTSTSTIGGANPLSSFYNIFLPLGVRHQLKQRADITFSYTNLTSTAANNPDAVNVWFYNATLGQFVLENTNRRLDTTNKTITVSVDHFSVFVVLDGKPVAQAQNATPFPSIIAYNFPNPTDCGVHSNVQTDTALAPQLGATFQPFAGTMVRYSLPFGPTAGVTIRFYSLSGQLVKTIDQGSVQGGFTNYQNWDCTNNSGRPVASGVYIGEIQWGKQRKFFKTAIIRGSGL